MYLNLEYFYYQVYLFLKKIYVFFSQGANLLAYLDWVKAISVLVSLLIGAGLIFSLWRLLRLRRKQLSELAKMVTESLPEERLSRWDKVKKYLESQNSSDWRRAILEADNLLDDIFKRIGYKGYNLGERLLKVKPYRFRCRNDLFKAHKVRNKIVREGVGFEMTREEAEEVIELYETALKELEYI